MLLAVVLSLIWAGANHEPARFVELSASEFEALKDGQALAAAAADREADRQAFITAALERRGHSGSTDYLQGCDLSDQEADYRVANLRLAASSADWATYDATWRSVGFASEATTDAPKDIPTVIKDAAQADQEVRRTLTQPLPGGEVGEAVSDLRLVSMCDQDLRHAVLLDSAPVRTLFATTDDGSLLRALHTMALHADHLPRLQDDYASIYMTRRAALGWPAEPGLRLKDRSRINLGLPQIYATGVLCEAGVPVFAGTTNLTEANVLRAEFGLPPEDLEKKAREGFCG